MNVKWKQTACFIVVALLLVLWIQPGMAQEAQTSEDNGSTTIPQFGGPNSVPGQLADDARLTESLTDSTMLQGYFDWKDRLSEEHGFSFSLDYSAGLLGTTNTLNEEDIFSGGAARFFGSWALVGRESGNTGSFIWKVENRHTYTDIPPSGAASQIGFAGVMYPIFSDIGTRLTNLFWKQNLNQAAWRSSQA